MYDSTENRFSRSFKYKLSKKQGKLPSTHIQNNVVLSVDKESNRGLLKDFILERLTNSLNMGQDLGNVLLSHSRYYSEIIKSEINQKSANEFSIAQVGISRHNNILDFVSFGSTYDGSEFATRLRSMGVFYPITPKITQEKDTINKGFNKWDSFPTHFVKLSEKLHSVHPKTTKQLWDFCKQFGPRK